MTADPKFFLFFFIQVIYIFTTTSLHPREVNVEHLQTMEENSVSFVYWEPKKSDYFSWKKKERGAKDNCVGGRPVFGGKSVPNLELYGAETDMDSYTPLCFSIRSLYIL